MSDASKVAKLFEKKIKNPKFMQKVYEYASLHGSDSIEIINRTLGYELAHIIATRGKDKSLNEIQDINKRTNEIQKFLYSKQNENTIYKNAIEDGFFTHSFNGNNLQTIKKNGLGAEKNFDPQIEEDLQIMEQYLGKTEYANLQQNSSSEFYFTSPGTKSIHYACSLSPERLYLGPLKQERDSSLPVEIGETKHDYMMKVVMEKIEKNGLTGENKDKVLESSERVISKFCTKQPVIALFPISSKKYNLTATHASSNFGTEIPISKHLENNDFTKDNEYTSPARFFTSNLGPFAETNNMGNLVSCQTKIPSSELGFASIPDSFEMLQEIAIARGMKKGDRIDFFTGMEYKEKELPPPEVVSITNEEIQEEKQNNPDLFPEELKPDIQKCIKTEKQQINNSYEKN